MDIEKKLRDIAGRQQEAVCRLVSPCRQICTLLRDLKMGETARTIEEILFEFDALGQEMKDLVMKNPTESFEALLNMLRSRDKM